MNIWFKALKEAYRFDYRGSISTEDLFNLDLKEIDIIYQGLMEEKDGLTGKSLLDEKTEDLEFVQSKIDVVKGIFDFKKTEIEKQAKAQKVKAMKSELNEVIAQKQKDELASMSIDQLKEIRDSL